VIALIHLKALLRPKVGAVDLKWTLLWASQATFTESLKVLGSDVKEESENFEVGPAEEPDATELLVLDRKRI
jgi:hypothetical protein